MRKSQTKIINSKIVITLRAVFETYQKIQVIIVRCYHLDSLCSLSIDKLEYRRTESDEISKNQSNKIKVTESKNTSVVCGINVPWQYNKISPDLVVFSLSFIG